jgi:hypothetical protein
MGVNRVFFPQEALDRWLEEGRIELEGEQMTLSPDGQTFRLSTAVRFLAEVAEGSDPNDLVGKIKTVEQVEAMAGELCSGSVILGDNAYEVVDGFVGEPLSIAPPADARGVARGSSLEGATRAAVGDAASDDADPLTRFFLGR